MMFDLKNILHVNYNVTEAWVINFTGNVILLIGCKLRKESEDVMKTCNQICANINAGNVAEGAADYSLAKFLYCAPISVYALLS
jgi:hypothetical protein